mgnify:CR=1 FL=1
MTICRRRPLACTARPARAGEGGGTGEGGNGVEGTGGGGNDGIYGSDFLTVGETFTLSVFGDKTEDTGS